MVFTWFVLKTHYIKVMQHISLQVYTKFLTKTKHQFLAPTQKLEKLKTSPPFTAALIKLTACILYSKDKALQSTAIFLPHSVR